VEDEDDRFITGKNDLVLVLGQTARILVGGLESGELQDIHKANPEVRQPLPKVID